MANQPPQQQPQKNQPGAGQQPPPGANVVTSPRPPGPPPSGGEKPSETDKGSGATPAAKPPVSGEGASGQRLPAPGEGPAKQTKPGEAGSDKAAVVSRTEKGDQTQGKGKLNIRLEQEDGKTVDHVINPETEATQYPFRIRVGGVIYERKRVDDQGREVYATDPY